MKSSTLKIISLVFLGLLAFWVFTTYFKKPPPAQNLAAQFKLSEIKDQTAAFVLKKDEESLTLKRESGTWKVGEYEADKEKIENLFKALSNLKISGPVSRNQQNHSQFEVDEEKGLQVSFQDKDDQEIVSLIIGKPGPGYTSNYLRKPAQDEVYLADANLNTLLPLQAEDWRQKTIAKIDRQSVKKITFAYPQEEFSLELQEDGSWLAKNKQEKKVEDEVINNFFDALNPLTATGFVEDEEEMKEFNQSQDFKTIRLLGDNDSVITELTFLEKENLSWAKIQDKEVIYQIPSSRLTALLKTSTDLF